MWLFTEHFTFYQFLPANDDFVIIVSYLLSSLCSCTSLYLCLPVKLFLGAQWQIMTAEVLQLFWQALPWWYESWLAGMILLMMWHLLYQTNMFSYLRRARFLRPGHLCGTALLHCEAVLSHTSGYCTWTLCNFDNVAIDCAALMTIKSVKSMSVYLIYIVVYKVLAM